MRKSCLNFTLAMRGYIIEVSNYHLLLAPFHLMLVKSLRFLFYLHFQPLLKFMIPLSVVYFAEYFINQGLVG